MFGFIIAFKKFFGMKLTPEQALYDHKGPVLIAVPKETPVRPADTAVSVAAPQKPSNVWSPTVPVTSFAAAPCATGTTEAIGATTHRQINEAGLRLVKGFEGCNLHAYLDDSSPPVATIGWGEIYHSDGSPVKMGETITQAQADAMLLVGLYQEASHFIDAWTQVALNENQYSALVSFVYNSGCGTYRRKVLPFVNANDMPRAMAGMSSCVTAGGNPLAGLIRRRKAECALFVGDIALMDKVLAE